MGTNGLKVQIAVSMRFQRALHNPSQGIRVLSSKTMVHFPNLFLIFIEFLTTNARLAPVLWCACTRVFTHYIITLEKTQMVSLRSLVKKCRVGLKTPSYFLKIVRHHCLTFFVKGVRLTFFAYSFCKHWVGTSAYVTRTWLHNAWG